MNSIKIILSILFMAAILASCGQKSGESLSLTTEIYCDHCKECESCKERVEKALKATPGVTSAEMKVDEKIIAVNYDGGKIDEQKIKEVIAQTGFDAGDVKADPTAYDNLDDCCKKK
ncbi:MAG: heavy-metal-associated domain-containing protein [Bacteroidia bacterium]